jgi:arylsulfatase A-like enzyme
VKVKVKVKVKVIVKPSIIIFCFLFSAVTTACQSSGNPGEGGAQLGGESVPKRASSKRAEKEKSQKALVSDGARAPARSSKRPNVIVILLDTLRPDYLGLYGAESEVAPFLAEIAGKSVVFENALSTSSWTAPSVASLFTSLYPTQHSVVQGFRAHRKIISKLNEEGSAELMVNHMPPDLATLPELFKAAGYRTFGLAANINIGDEIGFSRGFDRFEKHVRAPAEELYNKVAEWREEIVKQRPFFLYLHFNDAHIPYHIRNPYFKPAKSRKDDAAARYRSEIGYLDAYLKKTWQLSGLAENSVLVVLSDHGEEFWDHGSTQHGPTLYSELQYVVMMMYGPEHGIPAQRIKVNVSLVDVLPTLADLIGKPLAERREGVPLTPLFSSDDKGDALRKRLQDRCLFAHRMYSSSRKLALWSITWNNWKLIDWWGDRRKLFDHKTDRGEYHDLYLKRPKIAEKLYSRLSTFKERMERGQETTDQNEIDLDEDLLTKLKALGYVE